MKIPQILSRLRRSEEGFAMPTAAMMLFAMTGIVTVGVVSSIRTQSGVTRDQQTKSALPQAEAGVEQALLHFNRIPPGSNACSPVTSTGPNAQGWCSAVAGGFDGGSFAYQVRPAAGALEIVSVGSYDGVVRRVRANASSSSGQSMFFSATVKSQDSITLDSDAEIRANSATNGDIALNSNARQCGQSSVGIGRSMTLASNSRYFLGGDCTSQSTEPGQAEISLPTVNQGDVATVNDNGRFFALDPVSGNPSRACWNGVKGNGGSGSCGPRHLDIDSNTSVTLGGGKYSFCKLTMSSNTSLYVQAGRTVSIYFDSPEACGYPSGTTQMDIASNTRITATDGGPANVALLFVGSSSSETKINLSSNTTIGAACQQNFVVYAPRTDITLNANSTYCGAVAGKTLHMDSNARIYADDGARNFQLPNTAAHYELTGFVECTSATGSQPTTGC
ncbi:MAG: hypothetical protein H0V51_15145 [Chloroflexi bacterium]|nr:hypothetical protein [Chloroflexota bacterium]